MRRIAVIQARMGSKRLPRKVMQDLNGRPVIGQIIHRLGKVEVDDIVLCTTSNPEDDELEAYVKTLGVKVSRGPTNDLLGRVYQAMVENKADEMTRIYGDCPCVSATIINWLHINHGAPSCSVGFPKGMNAYWYAVEQVKFAYRTWRDDPVKNEFWHTFLMTEARMGVSPGDYHGFTFTLDTAEDLEYLRALFHDLGDDFGWRQAVQWAMEYAVKGNLTAGRVRNI
jgi:spore coat polysaccharide biosynthesis protein SpsF (cytidylyltransferase family)